MNSKIKTLSVTTYVGRHTSSRAERMLQPDFEKFFIVKVEEMFRTMKLPVPPVKSTVHSIAFLTEGEANIHIGSEEFTIHKNECFVVPSGQIFSFDKPDVNKGFLLSFKNEFIIGKFAKRQLLDEFDFLKIWGNPVIKLDSEVAKSVQQMMKRMLKDYTENRLSKTDIILPYLIAFLSELNRAYNPINSIKKNTSQHIAHQFKQLVYDNLKTKHLVSEYANLLNITPNHLNKTIKTHTGKSAIQWIDEAIVLEAKAMLHQTQLSISEIAEEVGFIDQSYFSRMFKKHEGITPLQFRKMIEKS